MDARREVGVGCTVTRRGLLLGGLAVAGGSLALGGLERAWAADGPPIISCDGWGARPADGPLPVYDKSPVKILVHHTATPNVASPGPDEAVALARSIQNFHM